LSLRITIERIEIETGQSDSAQQIAALIAQGRQLHRIIAGALVSGLNIADSASVPTTIEIEKEPIDIERMTRTIGNGIQRIVDKAEPRPIDAEPVRPLSAWNSEREEKPTSSEWTPESCSAQAERIANIVGRHVAERRIKRKAEPRPVDTELVSLAIEEKPKNGWSSERRAKQAERMKNIVNRRVAEGRHPGNKKATTSAVTESEPEDDSDAVAISPEALALIGGSAAKELANRPDVKVVETNESELDAEERAELEKPLPTPEEIFGRDVVKEAAFGKRSIDEVRRIMESTPGPAGRMAR
jgi:hypothetical protein